jgi:exopolyphosphatase / guanosine-5'-triphosphate,3'-diphosphate pyrophosphatase
MMIDRRGALPIQLSSMVPKAAKNSRKTGPLARVKGGPILACIDMGTNSFHMIVCHATPERDHFEVIIRAKEAVPFFRRSLSEHFIDATARRSASRIIRDMQKKAFVRGATSVIAVATSAVRESKNGEDVLEELRSELGVDARLISGKEEARLIYLGVLWSMPRLQNQFTIVDIGGGSTEIIVGDRERTYFSESYKLGAARLTQRFFKKTPTQESIRKLHEEVHGVMMPAAAKIQALAGVKKLIGTSGTIQALARLDRHALGKSAADSHGWKISLSRLEKIVEDFEFASIVGNRIKAVSADRAQTILAGAIVLLETMRALNAQEIVVCSAALREGVVVDHFLQTGWLTGDLASHKDPRSASVHDLLEKYQGDFAHAAQVAKLATELFLRTQHVLHTYSREVGHLLWCAAMLHDIGMFIGRNGHHKHSYYLIKNSGLLGYSQEEVEVIASIARYHRGSEPKENHEAYFCVQEESRALVADMASMLRIAEALDRSHRQAITGLNVEADAKASVDGRVGFRVELVVPLDETCEAEIWAFSEKKAMFENRFGLKASVEVRAGFAYAVN